MDHPSADVIRGGKVLIGVGGLTESRATKIGNAGISSGLPANLKVDVVEGVQELGAGLEVHALGDLDFLDQTDIEPGQAWSVEHQVCEAALAHKRLYAPATVRWSYILSCRGSQSTKPSSGTIKCATRVQNDVIRKEEHDAGAGCWI